jgi:hypothetical protein
VTPHYIIELGKWGVNIAFWPAFAFSFLISFIWPWWKSSWGINIVSLEFAIVLALISPVIATDFGAHFTSNITFAWIEIIALFLVGVIVTWRGALVISVQMKGTQKNRRIIAKQEEQEAIKKSD